MDNDTLNFELVLIPEGMSIDSNGKITWVPNNSQVGQNNVTVRVMDEQGAYDSQDYNIMVFNINDNPIIPSINNLSATEEQLFYFVINATDIDSDDSVSYYDDSDLFEIDKDTGEISFIPSNEDVGVYIVNITVKDDFGGSTIITITFSIIDVNDPPSLEPIEELNCNVGETFYYQVVANDMDPDDEISFSDDTDMFNIDPNTGKISFVPTKSDIGIHQITISVTDSEGATNQTTITIDIIGPKSEHPSDNNWVWIILVIIIILILVLYLFKRNKEVKHQDRDEIDSNEVVEFILEEP
jgi:hypothetical protein